MSGALHVDAHLSPRPYDLHTLVRRPETRLLPLPGNWRSMGSTKALVERFRRGCTNRGPRRASPLILMMKAACKRTHAEGFTTGCVRLAGARESVIGSSGLIVAERRCNRAPRAPSAGLRWWNAETIWYRSYRHGDVSEARASGLESMRTDDVRIDRSRFDP
jgi:hypothetical protein